MAGTSNILVDAQMERVAARMPNDSVNCQTPHLITNESAKVVPKSLSFFDAYSPLSLTGLGTNSRVIIHKTTAREKSNLRLPSYPRITPTDKLLAHIFQFLTLDAQNNFKW